LPMAMVEKCCATAAVIAATFSTCLFKTIMHMYHMLVDTSTITLVSQHTAPRSIYMEKGLYNNVYF
jgi:hypothetical protein